MTPEQPTRRPLDGLTVVSVEQAVAAPLASRHLADLGARVIKIERPDGGDFARYYDRAVNGVSAYFVWLNNSKESVTLHLGDSRTRGLLERLLAAADVYLHNIAPATARRLGLDADAVLARHPRVVACEVAGYASDGDSAGRKAYDLLIQAEAGVLTVTGDGDVRAKVGLSIADIAAGMYAYSGILAALHLRSRTGVGSVVPVTMLDTVTEWMSMPLLYSHYSGRSPMRTGARHATISPYGPFPVSDGEVLIAVQNEREWVRLCSEVLDDPELAADARFVTNTLRVEHRVELEELISEHTMTLPSSELIARLDRAEIAYGRSKGLDDVWATLERDGRLVEVATEGGPVRVQRAAQRVGAPAMPGPVPAVGADTDRVLTEFGVDAVDLAAWRAAAII